MDAPHPEARPQPLPVSWPKTQQPALLGCSGGADSVALLLLAIEAGWQTQLQVVYCHHGLRAEADAEAEFVAQLCKQQQVPFHLRQLALDPASKNLQAQARQARLQAFATLAQELQIELLFLAHHQDDQAETVLWHLLRGSGSKGLSGISLNSPFPASCKPPHASNALNLRIHRPLLPLRKSQIEAYLQARNQVWCTDSSNEKLDYQRNRLRLQVLPQLAEISQRELVTPLARSATILAAEDEFLNKLCQEHLAQLQNPKNKALDCHGLLKQPVALQRRILQAWLQAQDFHPQFDQVEQLRQVAQAVERPGGSPARLQLSQNLEIRRQNACLYHLPS